MDQKKELIKNIYEFLRKNNFNVSEPDLYGLVTFDLICKRDDERYILKILYNIDTFSKIGVDPLIKMSKLTGSTALIIGEKAGNGKLETGVLYFRHGVPILSSESFQDLINGNMPSIYSAPGGFYVGIDGKKMRSLREKKNYSIGYLSQKLGVSRRSVSLYENSNSATIDVYLKLESILNGDISRELELKTNGKEIDELAINILNDLVQEVFQRMGELGYRSEYIGRNPFDGISYNLNSFLIMGTCNNIDDNYKRIVAIKKISDVLEDTPVIINREYSEKEKVYGCPVINLSDLRKISDSDKFKRLIEKRL
ncbi:MAG: transcriptional regulator [Ferroplasma sp.]